MTRQVDPFQDAAVRLRQDSRIAEIEAEAGGSRLAENILYFVRTLRAAGLPLGTGKVLQALEAVQAAGLRRRDDFYWALHAVCVNRRDQQDIFDQAFHVFWRNPKFLDRMRALLLPEFTDESQQKPPIELNRRVAEALQQERPAEARGEDREEEIEIDAALTWSDKEMLQTRDFEKMSAAEEAEAKQIVRNMRLPIMELPTRRFERSPTIGRADLRASLRASLRSGGDILPLHWKRRRRRHPPLVILCDISGSMSRYSRIFLHFMHAITNDRDRVHCFLFGTRLTNITRHLRRRDVDEALKLSGEAAGDWSGGTRIASCLATFNKVWSRRVLGQGAVVLLITDGLDREGGRALEVEMERLHKSCRRLIWLNPLLRYEGYEPKSMGARAMMPHVDDFRPVHNLASLVELSEALGKSTTRRLTAARQWAG